MNWCLSRETYLICWWFVTTFSRSCTSWTSTHERKKRHRYYLPGTNMMNKSEINIKFWWKYLKSGKSTQREYDANLLLFFSIIGGTGDISYTYLYEKMLTFQNSMQIHLDLRQCFTIGLWWISHWESKFRIQN